MKTKVAILGAGIGGLGAAVRLAAAGFSVTVYEQHNTFGGKMGEWSKDGYRWDTGPSLFTMPHYVDELLQIDNIENIDFSYRKLETVCNYFWDDGVRLTASADKEILAKQFEEQLGESKETIQQFLSDSEQKYEITNPVFLQQSLHKLKTYFSWRTVKSFLRLPRVQVFKTMGEVNNSWFNNDKTKQFFNRYATYNGSDPYQAPATLNVIPHYEYGFGAYFPEGGIRSIAKSVYNKAMQLGVEFHFNASVESVEKRKKGYLINSSAEFDIVLSNIDIATASKGPLKSLLGSRSQNYEPSSSALIFYWGINRSFSELDTHNILFSKNYENEFSDIFNNKVIHEDPTVYVHISSKCESNDAPDGCENWFVMVNAPYDNNQDWNAMIDKAKSNILEKLSHNLGTDIAKHIVVENKLTPRMIQTKTGSNGGALYGSSSNNRMSAFLRQPNFSTKHKGLYFCGGSVHPGGGIPLSLLSAKIATDIIKDDYKVH